MSSKPLKIAVAPMDSAGHIYPCIGLAQALAKRGHTVELLLNELFVEQFAPFGFKIVVLRRTTPETETKIGADGQELVLKKSPMKGMADLLFSIGVIGPGTPLEKLRRATVNQTAYLKRYFADGVDYHPQLEAYFRSAKPDLVLIDNFLLPPSLHQAKLPYVFIHSGNPLALYKSDRLPPLGGGYPTDSDPASWAEFIRLSAEKRASTKEYQDQLYARFGLDPAEVESAEAKGRRLDIYGYPEELDYADIAPRPENLIRVDAFSYEAVKSESDEVSGFKLPNGFVSPGDRLIYLSLGSMCSVDVETMKKIVSALAKVPRAKVIVSKGQRADEYELPANAWGERFLPQAAILPLVDLVITHGGNNTITETFSHGKPMIAMGIFSDQADNAQRIQEKGYGLRLEPYCFTETELIEAVERLLGDEELKKRAKAAAARIARVNSKDLAAQKIEQFVAKLKKVSD